jgi:hypothetical protein
MKYSELRVGDTVRIKEGVLIRERIGVCPLYNGSIGTIVRCPSMYTNHSRAPVIYVKFSDLPHNNIAVFVHDLQIKH